MSCNDPDHMEEPVQCDCGEWCELQEMDMLDDDTPLICPECYRKAEKEAGL